MASTKGTRRAGTGRGVEEFRKSFDKSLIIPAKFREALEALGNSWETEGEFVKRLGCSQAEFGQYKEPFAEAHSIEVLVKGARKRVWAGTKAYAAKLRGIIANQ